MMTTKEIDGIIRTQLGSLQTANPYVDDFYNYAMLCNKALTLLGRQQLGPSQLPGIVPMPGVRSRGLGTRHWHRSVARCLLCRLFMVKF